MQNWIVVIQTTVVHFVSRTLPEPRRPEHLFTRISPDFIFVPRIEGRRVLTMNRLGFLEESGPLGVIRLAHSLFVFVHLADKYLLHRVCLQVDLFLVDLQRCCLFLLLLLLLRLVA